MGEHSRWRLQILRKVKPKNPVAGISENPLGSGAGNDLGEALRAIYSQLTLTGSSVLVMDQLVPLVSKAFILKLDYCFLS